LPLDCLWTLTGKRNITFRLGIDEGRAPWFTQKLDNCSAWGYKYYLFNNTYNATSNKLKLNMSEIIQPWLILDQVNRLIVINPHKLNDSHVGKHNLTFWTQVELRYRADNGSVRYVRDRYKRNWNVFIKARPPPPPVPNVTVALASPKSLTFDTSKKAPEFKDTLNRYFLHVNAT
jgi:hypothetical protein